MTNATDSGFAPVVPRANGPLESRAHALVGKVLCGRYRIERLLGAGGMGAVYAGCHRNGHAVAIKLLHDRPWLDTAAEKALRREARLANEVKHPGIVPVIDDDVTEDGHLFLVMPLLEGTTLQTRWEGQRGRLSLDELVPIALDLLSALAAAHERRIVHRDIKPANVFLTRGGDVRILDFGIARFFESDDPAMATRSGRAVGTPAFMAPEQALGRVRAIDGRTDLWAVGATMFALLSGRLVHVGASPAEIVVHAATRRAPKLAAVAEHVPPDVAGVIDRALAFELSDRWTDARAMAEALRLAHAAGRSRAGESVEPRTAAWRPLSEAFLGATRSLASLEASSAMETRTSDDDRSEPPTRSTERGGRNRVVVLAGVLAALSALAVPAARSLWTDAQRRPVARTRGEPPPALLARPPIDDRLATLTPSIVISAHQNGAFSVAVSPDGKTILSGGGDGAVKIWNAKDGAAIASLGGHGGRVYSVAFSGDGARAVSAGGGTATVWDMKTRRSVRSVGGGREVIDAAALTPDGEQVIAIEDGRGLTNYTVASGAARRFDPPVTLLGAVAVSGDGARAAATARDGAVRVWNLATGALERTIAAHARMSDGVTFTPDNRSLASSSDDGSGALWSVDDAHPRWRATRAGEAWSVTVNPEGDAVASGGGDGSIRVFRAIDGTTRLAFETRRLGVTALAFLPDGTSLLSSQASGQLAVWPLPRLGKVVPSPAELRETPAAASTPSAACARASALLDAWTGEADVLAEVSRLAERAAARDDRAACAYVQEARVAYRRGYELGKAYRPEALDAAEALLDRARTIDASLTAEHIARGWLLRARKDDSGARREGLAAETLAPESAPAHVLLATEAAEAGELERAEAYATQALAERPTRGEAASAYQALEEAYARGGDYDAASLAFENESKVLPESAWVGPNYASFLLEIGEIAKAVEVAKHAADFRATPRAHAVLARVYVAVGNSWLWDTTLGPTELDRARKAFERAIEQDPSAAGGHYGMAAYWRYVAVTRRDAEAARKAEGELRLAEAAHDPLAAQMLDDERHVSDWLAK